MGYSYSETTIEIVMAKKPKNVNFFAGIFVLLCCMNLPLFYLILFQLRLLPKKKKSNPSSCSSFVVVIVVKCMADFRIAVVST